MTIRSELLELQAEAGGLLKAEEVVQWARKNPKSAIHESIEWDNEKAGEQYRIWQVRRLIAIHVTSEKGVRQLVSLTIDRTEAGGYRDLNAVIADNSMREVLLADALAELDRVRLKYEALVELASVWDEVSKVRSKQRTKAGQAKRGKVRPSIGRAERRQAKTMQAKPSASA